MIFSFKFSNENSTVEETKQKMKDNLKNNIRIGTARIEFSKRFFIIWYWGGRELTGTNRHGDEFYERSHIISIGKIRKDKKQEKINVKGVHIINIFSYLIEFIAFFLFSFFFDQDLLLALSISIGFPVIRAIISRERNKDSALYMTKWMTRENHFYDDN